jgi:hypothetical protein
MKLFKTVSLVGIAAVSATLILVACNKEASISKISKTPSATPGAKIVSSAIFAPNANMHGHSYNEWSEAWVKWVYTLNCTLLNSETGTAASTALSPNVYMMTCPCFGSNQVITVPAGKALLFPVAWTFYDYPCSDDPAFAPAPGETVEHFLTEGARSAVDNFNTIVIQLDGVTITDLMDYRTAAYFNFTGNSAFASCWDPCITGTSQPGASDGYWYMLKPLSVGTHTISTSAIYDGYGPTEIATYTITVQ